MSVINNINDKDDKDYEPYDHRVVEKPSSNVRATANLIKASLGSGLLAGPLAFSNSGWGVGILGTLIVGFICGHCIHILVCEVHKHTIGVLVSYGPIPSSPDFKEETRAKHWDNYIIVKTSYGCCKIERKPQLGYGETCKSVFQNGPMCLRPFANAASIFAETALICTYVGVCCIYTVLISDSVKQLMDTYVPSVNLSVEYYCLIILIPLCVMCQIKYLKWLAIFSLLANVFLMLTYLICLYYAFEGDITLMDKKVIGDPARFPAFISTVIFAMEGIGVVMPVENAMKTPKSFLGCPSVLVVAMSVIVFSYTTLGLFGYLRYGDVLRGSITLNLPMNEWPAICAKIFIALSIFFTYPLQFYVVFDIFKRFSDTHGKEKYRTGIQVGARVLGVCFCVAIGMALPLLEQIINIVGACFYSILGLIIPSVIETVFRWENLGKLKWILWKNIFIVLFGLFSVFAGCTVTIMDIIEILNKKHV